jgi:hypothetical protein
MLQNRKLKKRVALAKLGWVVWLVLEEVYTHCGKCILLAVYD